MGSKIDTVEARARLKARPAPHWHKLEAGQHIGFRKMTASSSGTWIAQHRDTSTGTQVRRSLGGFDDLPPNERFTAAVKAARSWFAHLGQGGSHQVVTVSEACAAYGQHLRNKGRPTTADDVEARFRRRIEGDALALIELPKLTRNHMQAWRKRLEGTFVARKGSTTKTEGRTLSASGVNRDMTALRAALNHAHDEGSVTTDQAWRVALRPIKGADHRREGYLTAPQRAALVAASPSGLAEFIKALALVPVRPGALAKLTVAAFDRRSSVLTVAQDKAGADRKIKLPPSTALFFEAQSKQKLPGAPLLARPDGKHWGKDSWKAPLKAAALAAGLPSSTTAYTLRHSSITDLVTGGLDLLTVAQLSGTSVAMIERHYKHLRAEDSAAALARLAF